MKKYIFLISVLTCIFCACGKTTGTSDKVAENPVITETTAEVQETTSVTSHTTTVTTTVTTTSTSTETTSTTTETTVVTDVPPEPPDSLILYNYDTLDACSRVKVCEFISETNAELSEPDLLIDTTELGSWEVPVKFKYEGIEYEKWLAYNVVDTVQPTLLNMGREPYTKKGEPFNINSIIGYADNFDKHPYATYTGDVNTNEIGSYPISVTITDSSGNSSWFDMTVYVVDQIPEPADNNQRVDISWFTETYKNENTRLGLDVSEWQPDTDFYAVKDSGIDFIIMRMCCFYSEIRKDLCYDYNIEAVGNAGLDKGIYFYSTDTTEEGAREHARWIIQQLDGRKLDFPIGFDWEEFDHFQQYGISLYDLNMIFEAFADEVAKAGYSAMLYSSKNFLETVWQNYGNHPVWLAHYTTQTDYAGNYAIWQSSAYGIVPGVYGDADIDIQYMNMPLE